MELVKHNLMESGKYFLNHSKKQLKKFFNIKKLRFKLYQPPYLKIVLVFPIFQPNLKNS